MTTGFLEAFMNVLLGGVGPGPSASLSELASQVYPVA